MMHYGLVSPCAYALPKWDTQKMSMSEPLNIGKHLDVAPLVNIGKQVSWKAIHMQA